MSLYPRKPEALARVRGKIRELLAEIDADDTATLARTDELAAIMLPTHLQQTRLDQYTAATDLFELLLDKLVHAPALTLPPEMLPLFHEEENG